MRVHTPIFESFSYHDHFWSVKSCFLTSPDDHLNLHDHNMDLPVGHAKNQVIFTLNLKLEPVWPH